MKKNSILFDKVYQDFGKLLFEKSILKIATIIMLSFIHGQHTFGQPNLKKVLTFNSSNTPSCDWIYSIVASEDCVHYYFAGYSEIEQNGEIIRFPVMGKINSSTNKLIWERNYSINGFSGDGTFNSLIEDGSTLIAVGEQAESQSEPVNRRSIYNMVSSEDGEPLQYTLGINYPIALLANDYNSRLNEVKPLKNSIGEVNGFIGIGTKKPREGIDEKALFVKLNLNGDPDPSFGTNGVFEFNDDRQSRGINGIEVSGSQEVKYALVGRVAEVLVNPTASNVLVIALDSDGKQVWKEELGESVSEPGVTQNINYVDVNSGNEFNNCLAINYENSDQQGRDILQDGNNLVISAEFDYFTANFPTDCSPNNLTGDDTYRMLDGAIIKLDLEGKIDFSKNVGLFTGDAFYCDLEIKDGEYYILGSKAEVVTDPNTNLPRLKSKTQLVKTDSGGDIVYTKTVDKPTNAAWETDCGFDMAFTCDGEIIIGGDANINKEDYFIQVLSNDCQGKVPMGTNDITNVKNYSSFVNWNSSRKVKATVFVEDGGHLRIDGGAIIEFGASWELVELNELTSNNSDMVPKIIVKSGGTLTLDNAHLKGFNACSKEWMWEGIEVRNGGTIIIANNSIIEDAKIGILFDQGVYNANGNYNGTGLGGGGSITSNNSIIRNCRKCIHFAQSDNNVSRSLATTQFINNTGLKDPQYRACYIYSFQYPPPPCNIIQLGTKEFVSAHNIKNINFTSCEWLNSRSGSFPTELRGI
ncbi:MAG: hypothetical protein IT267_10115 [Saprospiraceae bacterium]|nr:hypothetical protein [Saprospiraceae bacterium]